MAVRRARRVFATREGGAGASQYTWSAVAVPSLMPFAAALEPDRHLSEVDKGGAESLRSPTRSSAPGVLEEHLAHAVPMGPGRQAGREMWHAEDGRPRGGVLSCILEALEEGVVARTVVEARDRRAFLSVRSSNALEEARSGVCRARRSRGGCGKKGH